MFVVAIFVVTGAHIVTHANVFFYATSANIGWKDGLEVLGFLGGG